MAPVMPPRSSALVRTNDAAPLAMKSAVFMCAPSEVSATHSGTRTRSASHLYAVTLNSRIGSSYQRYPASARAWPR